MAGLTNAESARVLDREFPTTGASDTVALSVDGSTEWAGLDRTAIGNYAAATVADPSVKANAAAITTAAASEAGTVTHFAIFTSDGTQRTDWQALTASRSLGEGDTATFAAGALRVTLT